jgi:hypothetical protein
MPLYRINPTRAAPVLRWASNLGGATTRALLEFPGGVLSVAVMPLQEALTLAAAGLPLPVAARHRVEAYKALQSEKAKEAERREAPRRKAREEAQAAKEERQAEKRRAGEEARKERLRLKRRAARARDDRGTAK